MAERELAGMLFVGDPHLSTRAPGWRKDDYPQAVLGKLRWCFKYARENHLLPILLGDLFHHPRDISNQLLVELLGILEEPIWAVTGNHDCHQNSLTDADSLSVLQAAGRIRLLDRDGPWVGAINGTTVVVGGTCWSEPIPESFDPSPYEVPGRKTQVFWVTHHDIRFPGNDAPATFDCCEIPGIDLVINGHVHRQFNDVTAGRTTWINPGNISRVQRSDVMRSHVPGALRIDITSTGFKSRRIQVPHQPFDEVFHPEMESSELSAGPSLFIKELALLEESRTASGIGLTEFLDANQDQFDPRVAVEIRALAQEVLNHAR